jgi:hypothetical protein
MIAACVAESRLKKPTAEGRHDRAQIFIIYISTSYPETNAS